ncbi:MAG: hypothetical protein ACI9EX_001077, partial [Oleispira sp.]
GLKKAPLIFESVTRLIENTAKQLPIPRLDIK